MPSDTTPTRRPTAQRTLRAAVAIGLVATALAPAGPAAGSTDDLLGPADGVYRAEITRTEFGIPHIVADDYGSLGFGQGYGAAEDIACSLADTLLTGRGERSKWFGPDERYDDQVTLNATNLQTDTLFTDVRDRGVVADLLASDDPGITPGAEVRAMVSGYIAGANTYFEEVGGADGLTDPACAGEEWVDAVLPATELDLYHGIYAANLLASTGVFVPEIADAAPPSVEDRDPGLPVGDASAATFAPVPAVLPDGGAIRAAIGNGGDTPFGSNGTALSGDVTDTGRGMLLGNPHFPWQGRYRFSQSQLTIPGVYDVRGAMLHGSPVVNIGWTDDVAWTHTVSTAFRFTPYEYRLVPGMPTTYVTEDGTAEVERREVEVELPGGETVTEDLYRTPEGYVVDDQRVTSGLLSWTAASVWAIRDANAEHLKTLDVFHEMAKATSVQELHDAQIATMGIPWVNTMAADRDGDVLYADNSVVPHVTDEQAEECLTPVGRVLVGLAGLPGLDGTRAQGACAWGSDNDAPRDGIFGEANLPDTLTLPQGTDTPSWVVNANDSYWLPNPETPLTGFAGIIGCEECLRSLRTRVVYRSVLDRLDGSDGLGGADEFTHDQLMAIETENRVFGAELSRAGGNLQTVCATAGVAAAACTALADWDGRTDVDSRGAILFREFFTGTNPTTRWTTPFDPSDPVGTPNTLNPADPQTLQAMRDAVAFLDDAGVAYDARLGSQQKAGDDGAGDIEVHGGLGNTTGNANALSFGSGTANTDVLYPVSYGSSHIQAVAFDDDGVDGCTILTYGQSSDASDANHDDQTALWSGEQWVCWPADPGAAAVSTVEVEGAVADDDADDTGAEVLDATAARQDSDALAATGGGRTVLLVGALFVGAAALLRRRDDAAG